MTIEAEWQSYDLAVVPHNAGSVQHEECRRAFYAGAVACLSTIVDMLDSRSKEPTEQDLQKMQVLHDELTAFAQSIKPDA
jgi:hypothetical protein